MKELKEVYNEDGEFLGDEFIDISGLQTDTKKAIIHLLYMDIEIDNLSDEISILSSSNIK